MVCFLGRAVQMAQSRVSVAMVAAAVTCASALVGGVSPAAAVTGCGGAIRGTALSVPGFGDRPTRLELAPDPSAPLLVMFHGMNGCIQYLQRQSGLTVTSGNEPVSLLWMSGVPSAPGATSRNWDYWSSWSASQSMYEYIHRSIATARDSGVTTNTVIAVGISQGGFMVQRAICGTAKLAGGATYDGAVEFQGIVSVVGPDEFTCRRRTNRSLMVVETTGDGPVKAGGAAGAKKAYNLRDRWLSSQTTCPSSVAAPDAKVSQGRLLSNMWVNCSATSMVRMVVVKGLGHTWPRTNEYDMNVDIARFANALNAPGRDAATVRC